MYTKDIMATNKEENNIRFFDSNESVERYNRDDVKIGEKRLLPEHFDEPGLLLELGCGAGRVTPFLRELGHDVVAFDAAPNMVQKAAERYSDFSFLIMDAGNLGFEDELFDYCFFSFNGIDYLHPYQRRVNALEEVYRVLKPGGVFIFSSHNQFAIPLRPWNIPSFLKTEVLSGNIFQTYRERTPPNDSSLSFYTYHGNPRSERRQLRKVGFDVLDVQDPKDTFRRYISSSLYYVVQKPGNSITRE